MSAAEGRYRKLYQRIWANPGFVALDLSGRVFALYVLTGPQSNRIGLFRFSPGGAAEDLAMKAGAVAGHLRAVQEAFAWEYDPEARVLWIPSWWKFNPPQNPKHLAGVLTDLVEVPASLLVTAFSTHLVHLAPTLHDPFRLAVSQRVGHTVSQTVSETVSGAFPEPSTKPDRQGIGKQEQEQEQEQEQDSRTAAAPLGPAVRDGEPSDRDAEIGAFVRFFCEHYREHRHATYMLDRKRDVPLIRGLLKHWPLERLQDLARLLLLLPDGADSLIDESDRGVRILSVKASWLDVRLAQAEHRGVR